MNSYATTLHCWTCEADHVAERARLLCDCGMPLEQSYDIDALLADSASAFPEPLAAYGNIWRFHALLPVQDPAKVVSLGEGCTPLVPLPRFGADHDLRIIVKDESRNPTGTFKARGASVGVSRLRELGWTALAMPTVGSGGSAWSAYGARAGLEMAVALPTMDDIPRIGLIEPQAYGAQLAQYGGPTEHAFAAFRRDLPDRFAYVGGLQEPYRLEGEKTILFELVEQLGGSVPEYIVWPTGGAVGLVGLAKAYEELVRAKVVAADEQMTVISAQHEKSAPIAAALRDGLADPVVGSPAGIAPGVWVGDPFAGRYVIDRMRRTVRADGGVAGDDQIRQVMSEVARSDGLLLSPEGALAVCVALNSRAAGRITAGSTVICVNTASSLRYPHLLEPNEEAA
jgi:threonine synthase